MKIFDLNTTDVVQVMRFLRRHTAADSKVVKKVATIVAEIRKNGDRALTSYIQRLDGALSPSIICSQTQLRRRAAQCPRDVQRALAHAARNIERFHTACLRQRETVCQVEPGIQVWREFRAIDRVGIYVPGGRASYPSTVLMGAIPARVAGCREVVVATPIVDEISPIIAQACVMAGVDTVYAMGGAHAIAALAYGTEAVAAVDKIVGPGNRWVTEAKQQVYGAVDIDMPAGPSEVMVLADTSANAAHVAADMLSQLEHSPDAQAVLVTTDAALIGKVERELQCQMKRLSRYAILKDSVAISALIKAPSVVQMVAMANAYAPEHLEIVTRKPQAILKHIRHAGSVFLGPWSSEPLGDYATGANHTLPTNGGARAFGPLGIESFGKWMQVQEVTRQGFKRLEKTVAALAAAEGLDAHRNAVLIRSEK